MASIRLSPLLCGLLLSACGRADASTLDPSNPIHCALAFQRYSDLAMTTGDERLAKGLGGRAQWYVDRAKSSGQTLPSREELERLAERFLAAADGGRRWAMSVSKGRTRTRNSRPCCGSNSASRELAAKRGWKTEDWG